MNAEIIVRIALYILGFLITVLIPTSITFFKKYKDAKNAKSESEKKAAINDMREAAQNFIIEAEELYRNVDTVMKQNGSSCGKIKKDGVMNKLMSLSLEKGIAFDSEYWSKTVDELVAMTKKVNRN